MNKESLKKNFIWFLIGICILSFLGLIGPIKNDINVEYVNGLFTVASILTGFLAAIITIEPKSRLEEFYREEIFGYLIMLNLMLMGIALIFYSVSAIFRVGFIIHAFIILDSVIILDLASFWIAFPEWLKLTRNEKKQELYQS